MIRVLLFGILASVPGFGRGTAARAETAVEGVVKLPPALTAPAVSRYAPNLTPGPPDPPAAVVYLEGSFPSPPRTNEMWQSHYQFSPGLLVIPKGSMVAFPNGDDAYHNVFSYSKAKRFDLGRYRKNETPATQVFDQAGVVRLYCEIHKHMRGVIVVLDTRYFTKTAGKGRYKLDLTGVPPGHYVLKAWIDEKTTMERPIEVRDGVVARVDFPEK